MIITYHREKLLNAIIYFAKNTRFCGKTKLMKLLYFLDFEHFKKTGKTVTGQDYFAWEMGPVPKSLFEELSGSMEPDMKRAIYDLPGNDGFQQIRPKKKFDSQYFSKNEIASLEKWAYIFKDTKADEMIEATHLKNQPWDHTIKTKGEFAQIDCMLAIDGAADSLSYEEAEERLRSRLEMYEALGTV